MTWRWATHPEAVRLSEAVSKGHGAQKMGVMNHLNLLVLEHEGRIDGLLYAIPDSYYTLISEVWFRGPVAALKFREGLNKLLDERACSRTVAGYVEVSSSRWVNALMKQGGQYRKACIQLDWRE